MLEEVKERLVRIETKVDMVVAARQDDKVEAAKLQIDMVWVKGGLAIVLSIILGCAGWLAMQYFSNIGG